jgi:hypothetical protein
VVVALVHKVVESVGKVAARKVVAPMEGLVLKERAVGSVGGVVAAAVSPRAGGSEVAAGASDKEVEEAGASWVGAVAAWAVGAVESPVVEGALAPPGRRERTPHSPPDCSPAEGIRSRPTIVP